MMMMSISYFTLFHYKMIMIDGYLMLHKRKQKKRLQFGGNCEERAHTEQHKPAAMEKKIPQHLQIGVERV